MAMSYDTENIKTLKQSVDCLFSRRRKASKLRIQHTKYKVSI